MRSLCVLTILFLMASRACYGIDTKDEKYLRGVAYAIQGDFEKADKEFERTLRQDPFLVYASSCRQMIADAISGRIKRETAMDIFRGIDYSNREQWSDALMEFDSAISYEPDCAYIYNERGITYDLSGENEKAIEDFSEAIRLKPDYEYAYNNRGHAYVLVERYDDAVADFKKAVELNPYYAIAHYNLGWIYSVQKGRHDDAIASFNRAIEINPKFDDAYADRGFAYFNKMKYNEALDDFNKAVSINPNNVRAQWNKAVLLEKMGRKDEAVAAYLTAIERAPPGSDYIEEARLKIQSIRK